MFLTTVTKSLHTLLASLNSTISDLESGIFIGELPFFVHFLNWGKRAPEP